ncbi:hypothetical protein [Pseudoalteromonas luteoviolacea]|uniref:Uncharacterized protein n=1 Tax=Pseudoalteromonas luteoviolacea NCIMB 1942 TaxID=1365253 RepID=A0A161XVP1_9GAMM|nr:hypothetical protein [Pseudoalteromonas luteoviolacea]KZN44175.1 hypothetical protein N482_17400 [Pseudoalteromonas luteoviolacea NCIMB 1942]KZW98753.1 hypothetical protein JL49_21265 [Pseudoalteromonas luteoviolacea]
MNIEVYANKQSAVIENLLMGAEKFHCVFIDENSELEADFYLFILLQEDLANRHIPTTLPRLVDYSNKYPEKTLFCFAQDQGVELITDHQLKSINAVGKLVEDNGARWLTELPSILDVLLDYDGSPLC